MKKSTLTTFQIKCLHIFWDLKLKQGCMARIDYRGQVGVTVTNGRGERAFYALAAIMDPINRHILTIVKGH